MFFAAWRESVKTSPYITDYGIIMEKNRVYLSTSVQVDNVKFILLPVFSWTTFRSILIEPDIFWEGVINGKNKNR